MKFQYNKINKKIIISMYYTILHMLIYMKYIDEIERKEYINFNQSFYYLLHFTVISK